MPQYLITVLRITDGLKCEIRIVPFPCHQKPALLPQPPYGFRRLLFLLFLPVEVKYIVPGITIPYNALHPRHQGSRRGNHHQYHGGQDTDICQPHRVLLHPVNHTGHAHKMLRAVIIFFIFPKHLQKGNASRSKQQIGPRDDQEYRHKKQQYGSDGVLGGNGDIIAAPQRSQSPDCQQPVGLWLPLPLTSGPQQPNGVRRTNLPDAVGVNQQKYSQEKGDCGCYRLRRDEKSQRHLRPHYPDHAQEHYLVQSHPKQQSQPQGNQCHINGLPAHHPGKMPSLHTQDVEDPEFLFPLLHQEAVGVKQENKSKNRYNPAPKPHGSVQEIPSKHILQPRIQRQGLYDIEHRHRQNAGQHIGNIRFPVLFYIFCR